MAVRQGREPWEGRARVRLGGPGARQGRVPVPHSTAPFSLGGHPRGVAGMGPGLTRGGWGGPSVPWRCLLSAKGGGGAAWQSWSRGPAIGQGGRPYPPPPSTESRILPQSLSGAPHPPAIVARRWPAGGGREG